MGILIGDPHETIAPGSLSDPGERPYLVTLVNESGQTLTCVVVIVARTSRPDHFLPLFAWHLAPGERRRLLLGPAGDVRRYAAAAFIGEERVARLPGHGRAVAVDPGALRGQPGEVWTIMPQADGRPR